MTSRFFMSDSESESESSEEEVIKEPTGISAAAFAVMKCFWYCLNVFIFETSLCYIVLGKWLYLIQNFLLK